MDRGSWSNDPRLRHMTIVVCTTGCTLVGTAHLMAQHRLLDELNDGSVAGLYGLGNEFLPLTETRIFYPGGAQDIALSIHVRKSSILLVAEGPAAGCGAAGPREVKAASYRTRKTLPARALVPPYVLEGKVHVALWEELAGALEGDMRFLPMTDITVSPALPNGESTAAFAAVNTEQIVHISQVSEVLERLRQDAQKTLGARAAAGPTGSSAWTASAARGGHP